MFLFIIMKDHFSQCTSATDVLFGQWHRGNIRFLVKRKYIVSYVLMQLINSKHLNGVVFPHHWLETQSPETTEHTLQYFVLLVVTSKPLKYTQGCQMTGEILKWWVDLTRSCLLYWVSRAILCARSQYFRAMLSGSWMESSRQCITLQG